MDMVKLANDLLARPVKENGKEIKFTPAPWDYREGLGWLDVYAHDHLHNNETFILHINEPSKTQKANAKLVAAAPDLLEACKKALSYLPCKDGRLLMAGDPDEKAQWLICNELKQAIAKAKQQ